jgi:hypothetical protein
MLLMTLKICCVVLLTYLMGGLLMVALEAIWRYMG